jgi:hypothetical protein
VRGALVRTGVSPALHAEVAGAAICLRPRARPHSSVHNLRSAIVHVRRSNKQKKEKGKEKEKETIFDVL